MKQRVSRRWRTATVLAIGVAIGSALVATPVSSHVGGTVTHLWNDHIRPKADARYYTKAQANARYVNVGEKATSAANADNADAVDGKDAADLAAAGVHAAAANFFSWTGARDCDNVFGQLEGPAVTVDVGPSGLVAVFAQADIQDFGGTLGRVQLEETSTLGCPTILKGDAGTNSAQTKRTLPGTDVGTTGLGSVLVFRVSPGTRTFTLRYGSDPDAGFSTNVSNRRLWVQPL
jgi:hypothetical protein